MSDTKKLAAAAARGDLAAVKKGISNDPTAARHWKPIMDACFYGQARVVRALLAAGADVNVVAGNPSRHRPIHRTIEPKATMPRGPEHLAVAKILCEAGADLEVGGGNYRWRPLAMAANGGSAEIVECLLEAGARRDIFTSASLCDAAGVRRSLKRNPALASAPDDAGRTPLHYLCASGLFLADPSASKRAVAIATALVEAGADVDAEWTAAEGHPTHPARPIWWATSWRAHEGLVRALLELGADAQGALHLAALEAPPAILELLLAHGAKIDHRKEGRTALHDLLGHRLPANTVWLLDHGANPNLAAKEDGSTPLHLAASFGARREILHALVDHGARLDAKDKAGLTPLAVAKAGGKKKAVEWLRAAGAR